MTGESGQADAVRARHRDHYTSVAALLDTSPHTSYEQRLERTDTEIDNLRAAFAWSRENCDIGLALALASSLQPLWLARGRIREGSAWFDAALTDADVHRADVAPAVRARALADNSVLDVYAGATDRMEQAQEALAVAREVDDPALLAWALVACGGLAVYPEVALPYLAEAIGLARSIDDNWQLSQTLHLQAYGLAMAGEPIAARAAAEEGRDLADAIGDRFVSRACRWDLGVAQLMTGDLVGAIAQLREVIAEADATHDTIWGCAALCMQALVLAYHGDPSAARSLAGSTRASPTWG